MYCNILYFLFCVSILTTCVAVSDHWLRASQTDLLASYNIVQNHADRALQAIRNKRSLTWAVKGINALRKLLDGADPLHSSGRKWRNYEKLGDFDRALKDFYSVNPVNVHTRTTESGVKIVKGVIGDRKLSLRSRSYGGDPVLDIIDYKLKNSGDRYIDRVIYTEQKRS